MAKKPKPRRKPIDARRLYINACTYLWASRELAASKNIQLTHNPMIMCEAFALELMLKCLHRIRRRNIFGHNISTVIWPKLSKADQHAIVRYHSKLVAAHPQVKWAKSNGVSLKLDEILKRANSFVSVRYWHEGDAGSVDSANIVSHAGVSELLTAVWCRIIFLRPRWRTTRFSLPALAQTVPPATWQFHPPPALRDEPEWPLWAGNQ
jgi:hypothetical protein